MIVYSTEYDQLGILKNGLVQIADWNLFIPYTDDWIVVSNDM